MPQQVDSSLTLREPYIVSVIMDPKNQTVPTGSYSSTTYNIFSENGKVKKYNGDKNITIFFKPMCTEQFGGGALRFIKPAWTSTNADGLALPHRGFHIFFHNANFSTQFNSYDVYATYYLQFKGLK
jgi:hypothetical protein